MQIPQQLNYLVVQAIIAKNQHFNYRGILKSCLISDLHILRINCVLLPKERELNKLGTKIRYSLQMEKCFT